MPGDSAVPDDFLKPIEIFISYSRKDEKFRSQLVATLASLMRQGIISLWHDREITVGAEWRQAVDAHINSAQLILLLVSQDFIASDYCYNAEMRQALERHERGDARVMPIILRPVDLEGTPLAKLQALPRDGKPVTSWADRDEAFLDIARSIRLVCEDLVAPNVPLVQPPKTSNQEILTIYKGLQVY